MNQVLDQKLHFEKNFFQIKVENKLDIESYGVRCCLIIGRIPSDEAMKKCFEIFRSNSVKRSDHHV